MSAIDTFLNGDPLTVNDLENREAIAPKETSLNIKGKSFNAELDPNSFHVYRVKVK